MICYHTCIVYGLIARGMIKINRVGKNLKSAALLLLCFLMVCIGVLAIGGSETRAAVSQSPFVTLSVDKAISEYGQTVLFTVKVTAADPGSAAPTGMVDFYLNDVNILGALPLNTNGEATLASSRPLPAGNHAVKAVYNGDVNYTGASAVVNLTVIKTSSTAQLVVNPNPLKPGQLVTLSAYIPAINPNADAPTGSVTFFDGTTSLGSATLSGGIAYFTTTSLGFGTHALTVRYDGDVNYNASTSQAVAATVKNPTTTQVSAPSQVGLGDAVTITAAVKAEDSSLAAPTGSVSFYDTYNYGVPTLLGTVSLDSSGTASQGDDHAGGSRDHRRTAAPPLRTDLMKKRIIRLPA